MKTHILMLGLMLAGPAVACDLKIESAWIRTAPPNAATLAGYATLRNTGKTPLHINRLQSAAFASVEMHETVVENGVSKMRPLKQAAIPAQGALEFAPGGKHLMLVNPKQALKKGDAVTLSIEDSTGCVSTAEFAVTDAAPGVSVTRDEATKHEHHHE